MSDVNASYGKFFGLIWFFGKKHTVHFMNFTVFTCRLLGQRVFVCLYEFVYLKCQMSYFDPYF